MLRTLEALCSPGSDAKACRTLVLPWHPTTSPEPYARTLRAEPASACAQVTGPSLEALRLVKGDMMDLLSRMQAIRQVGGLAGMVPAAGAWSACMLQCQRMHYTACRPSTRWGTLAGVLPAAGAW